MSSVGSILGTAAVTIGRGAAAAVGDGLSFASELLRAVGGQSAAETTDAGDSEDALAGQIAIFQARIQRFLAEAGIVLSQPVMLTGDGLGGISVVGNHPQQAAIEAALDSDVLLERDFQALASECAESEAFTLEVDTGSPQLRKIEYQASGTMP